jgi:hypothetical protein
MRRRKEGIEIGRNLENLQGNLAEEGWGIRVGE